MIQINYKKDCCGCNACVENCPGKCIMMKEDLEAGKEYVCGFAAWYVSKLLSLKLTTYALNGYVAPGIFFISLILPGYFLALQEVFEGWGGLVLSGLIIGLWALILLLVLEWRLIKSYFAAGEVVGLAQNYRQKSF